MTWTKILLSLSFKCILGNSGERKEGGRDDIRVSKDAGSIVLDLPKGDPLKGSEVCCDDNSQSAQSAMGTEEKHVPT